MSSQEIYDLYVRNQQLEAEIAHLQEELAYLRNGPDKFHLTLLSILLTHFTEDELERLLVHEALLADEGYRLPGKNEEHW